MRFCWVFKKFFFIFMSASITTDYRRHRTTRATNDRYTMDYSRQN